MRLKHEVRQVEAPRSLVLSNSSTRDVEEKLLKNSDKVSPETLSHRLQKGWQHLQECHDPFLSNNNNALDINDNNFDDVSVASSTEVSASFLDGDYRAMSSDDSGSSSEDESSASYSDTSPLLDVSSLGNSDASLDDSDMSEDSSSTSSSSSAEGSLLEGSNNLNNNNGDDDEDEEDMGVPLSMQSSWMSFSSAASSPAGPSRGQVILPDVLPVGKMMRNEADDPMICDNAPSPSMLATRNLEITFEKRRSIQDSGASRVQGDCCLVEITTQPDVQVDIRVNPVTTRSYRENKAVSIKHGNTYPRETKNNKRYLKNRESNSWVVNDSFEDRSDDGYWTLGDGIRLNNYTIVNGFKTLSLTELVKPNTNEENDHTSSFESKVRNTSANTTRLSKTTTSPSTNSCQNFERNYSKLPANVHACCKDNWRFQRDGNNAILKNSPHIEDTQNNKCSSVSAQNSKCNSITLKTEIDSYSSRIGSQSSRNSTNKELFLDTPKTNVSSRLTGVDDNSNKLSHVEKLSLKSTDSTHCHSTRGKVGDSKLSSPELFEVYTMEAAIPHVNWSAVSKMNRESEWIRKRRNDREEIRRKLAMDSDTEDYISEKLSQHRDGGSSFDRLKGSGNLQICFMNEAAKDQDLSNPEDELSVNKTKAPFPQLQKPSPRQLPSEAFPKCDKGTLKLPNNNNSPTTITKRQRPKFFFNRPRSWHASKPEEIHHPEEDLLTRHIRLQAEAREALAQAKDMAKMQMEIERQKKKKSPIAEMVGIPFPDGKHLTYHALAAMNVAQLQVIVNDLHSQIETLNEDLVKFLLERDDLHMEQDSMLVDIEDLTRYLGLKGSGSVSSSGSQISVNSASSDNKKTLNSETVKRSQSVHLKSKNLM